MRVCLIFDISSIPKEHARAGPSVSIRSSSERSLAKDNTDTPALVVSLVGNSLYTLLPSTSVCEMRSLFAVEPLESMFSLLLTPLFHSLISLGAQCLVEVSLHKKCTHRSLLSHFRTQCDVLTPQCHIKVGECTIIQPLTPGIRVHDIHSRDSS